MSGRFVHVFGHPMQVTDFGISKVQTDTMMSQTSAGVGTVPYMAPELLDDSKYTEKVDVYAFAMVIFETLSCRAFHSLMLDEGVAIKDGERCSVFVRDLWGATIQHMVVKDEAEVPTLVVVSRREVVQEHETDREREWMGVVCFLCGFSCC